VAASSHLALLDGILEASLIREQHMAQHTDESAPDPAEDRLGEELPLIELETLLSRPPSLRKRLAQLGFVLLAALVALALFWGGIAPGKQPGTTAAPTPTLSPRSLLIASNVNYGTVTINGQKQGRSLPLVIPVQSDTYTISLDTPPFRRISCHARLTDVALAGAPAGDPNCLALAAPANSPAGTPTYQIYISLTPADLPPDQQSQVTSLLTRTWTMQEDLTVPVGSYFATSFQAFTPIGSQRATVPLEASASIAPFASQHLESSLLCTGFVCPWMLSQSTYSFIGHQWAITVTLALRWRFSTASGEVVSDVFFRGDNPYFQVDTFASLFLTLDGAGGWTISQKAPAPDVSISLQESFCSIGENILQAAAPPGPNGGLLTLHDRGAQGCEWQVQVNGIDQGTFLWRFGVLLAVDAKTHAAYPDLPVAPPEEVAALGG
jgi:hypothetical protein